ncbi:hypothetical protein SAMN05428944_6472 [Streptomyces sp. 1222.5]|nr:hypothetical protein BX260_1623 [Streptomyces sp. 5112.2]SEC54796.1 hypothetical protein SAMN05216532_1702 [Streptomyces sp. 2231.1]SED12110.1 hypothetical protein SAMN05428944_6472 [Streptomyces sp. 1222.5]
MKPAEHRPSPPAPAYTPVSRAPVPSGGAPVSPAPSDRTARSHPA